MGEAAEASKTLHNWMGEPGQGDRDDEEKTLQLSLGLPGGGGGPAAAWRAPCRENGSHSAAGSSMLSLGYSNAAFSPCSQGKAKGSPAVATGHALPSTNNASQIRCESIITPHMPNSARNSYQLFSSKSWHLVLFKCLRPQ
jgi:auxin-responsive protein IAA